MRIAAFRPRNGAISAKSIPRSLQRVANTKATVPARTGATEHARCVHNAESWGLIQRGRRMALTSVWSTCVLVNDVNCFGHVLIQEGGICL